MTDPDAVKAALLDWAGSMNPDNVCLLQMNTGEIVTLHFMLALLQWMLESGKTVVAPMDDLGSIRKKVEKILVQAGYGGDPRP